MNNIDAGLLPCQPLSGAELVEVAREVTGANFMSSCGSAWTQEHGNWRPGLGPDADQHSRSQALYILEWFAEANRDDCDLWFTPIDKDYMFALIQRNDINGLQRLVLQIRETAK